MIKVAIVLVVLFFIGGFLFRILFKIGILALIVLGVLYLFKRVFR
jgi:hypothetical protein